MADEEKKCVRGKLPVVRLTLRNEACVRLPSKSISNYDSAIEYVKAAYGCLSQEYMVAVAVDPQNRPLGIVEVSVGGVDFAHVDPRVLFSALLLMNASAFILVHNHPSGNPEPSADDVEMTKRIKDGAKLLLIRLLDHIVVTRQGSVSFLDRGLLPLG